jgi:hypothetical protein
MEVLKWSAKNTVDAINASMQKMTAILSAFGATKQKLIKDLAIGKLRKEADLEMIASSLISVACSHKLNF